MVSRLREKLVVLDSFTCQCQVWILRSLSSSFDRGFRDSRTAELMLQRAKKLKYNSLRKKKLSQLGRYIFRHTLYSRKTSVRSFSFQLCVKDPLKQDIFSSVETERF